MISPRTKNRNTAHAAVGLRQLRKATAAALVGAATSVLGVVACNDEPVGVPSGAVEPVAAPTYRDYSIKTLLRKKGQAPQLLEFGVPIAGGAEPVLSQAPAAPRGKARGQGPSRREGSRGYYADEESGWALPIMSTSR